MLGIGPHAWNEAREVMGEDAAAVTVAAILQRAEYIKRVSLAHAEGAEVPAGFHEGDSESPQEIGPWLSLGRLGNRS